METEKKRKRYLVVSHTEDEIHYLDRVDQLLLLPEEAAQLHRFLVESSKFFNDYLSRGTDVYYGCLPEDSVWVVRSNSGGEKCVFPKDSSNEFSPYMEEENDYTKKVRRGELSEIAAKSYAFSSLKDMFSRDMLNTILECRYIPSKHGDDAAAYVLRKFVKASRNAPIPEFLYPLFRKRTFSEFLDIDAYHTAIHSK